MPYIVAPGGTYDMTAFSCFYAQQDTGAATWGVYASQIDYSNPVPLASGYPDQKAAQTAIEQVLGTDAQVRQMPHP